MASLPPGLYFSPALTCSGAAGQRANATLLQPGSSWHPVGSPDVSWNSPRAGGGLPAEVPTQREELTPRPHPRPSLLPQVEGEETTAQGDPGAGPQRGSTFTRKNRLQARRTVPTTPTHRPSHPHPTPDAGNLHSGGRQGWSLFRWGVGADPSSPPLAPENYSTKHLPAPRPNLSGVPARLAEAPTCVCVEGAVLRQLVPIARPFKMQI